MHSGSFENTIVLMMMSELVIKKVANKSYYSPDLRVVNGPTSSGLTPKNDVKLKPGPKQPKRHV